MRNKQKVIKLIIYRVKAELLVMMDGVSSSSSASANDQVEEEQRKLVMVLGATNRPWDLDEALRRRFEKRIYIPLPTAIGREDLFRINLKGTDIADDVDFSILVKKTEGYSGADISNVCREAALMPIKRILEQNKGDIMNMMNNESFKNKLNTPISMQDLEIALKNISKSVSEISLSDYEKWTKEFKSS
jgi:katanin p60 ATPase-containing subunit A1